MSIRWSLPNAGDPQALLPTRLLRGSLWVASSWETVSAAQSTHQHGSKSMSVSPHSSAEHPSDLAGTHSAELLNSAHDNPRSFPRVGDRILEGRGAALVNPTCIVQPRDGWSAQPGAPAARPGASCLLSQRQPAPRRKRRFSPQPRCRASLAFSSKFTDLTFDYGTALFTKF